MLYSVCGGVPGAMKLIGETLESQASAAGPPPYSAKFAAEIARNEAADAPLNQFPDGACARLLSSSVAVIMSVR